MTEYLRDDIVRVEVCDDGDFWRVTLNDPPKNLLDEAMIAALHETFEQAGRTKDLRAVVLIGEGQHFSFGGSPESFLPDRAREEYPEIFKWLDNERFFRSVRSFPGQEPQFEREVFHYRGGVFDWLFETAPSRPDTKE